MGLGITLAGMQLNLPAYEFKIIQKGEKRQVFDTFRKKYVALTPEEWVRQHLCRYMVEELGYPAGRMSLEGGVVVNGISSRWDVLVFDENGSPEILVECKAPQVKLSNAVLDQALRYQKGTGANTIIVSNGVEHLYIRLDGEKARGSRGLPPYRYQAD